MLTKSSETSTLRLKTHYKYTKCTFQPPKGGFQIPITKKISSTRVYEISYRVTFILN